MSNTFCVGSCGFCGSFLIGCLIILWYSANLSNVCIASWFFALNGCLYFSWYVTFFSYSSNLFVRSFIALSFSTVKSFLACLSIIWLARLYLDSIDSKLGDFSPLNSLPWYTMLSSYRLLVAS